MKEISTKKKFIKEGFHKKKKENSQEMFSQKMDSASPCKFKIKGRLGKRNKSKIQMGRKNERVED